MDTFWHFGEIIWTHDVMTRISEPCIYLKTIKVSENSSNEIYQFNQSCEIGKIIVKYQIINYIPDHSTIINNLKPNNQLI